MDDARTPSTQFPSRGMGRRAGISYDITTSFRNWLDCISSHRNINLISLHVPHPQRKVQWRHSDWSKSDHDKSLMGKVETNQKLTTEYLVNWWNWWRTNHNHWFHVIGPQWIRVCRIVLQHFNWRSIAETENSSWEVLWKNVAWSKYIYPYTAFFIRNNKYKKHKGQCPEPCEIFNLSSSNKSAIPFVK